MLDEDGAAPGEDRRTRGEELAHTALLNSGINTFGADFIAASDRLGRYDNTVSEVTQMLELLGLSSDVRVLDACCGFGRTSGAFAQLGCEVVGVDISPEAIAMASRRFPGPKYVIADMTSPSLSLGKFDLVVNLYSSFGYGRTREDDRDMLACWHANLRPGGRLIMELSDLERARNRLGEVEHEVVRRHDEDGVVETLSVDWDTGVLRVRYDVNEHSVVTLIRMYEADDLAQMLSSARFGDIERYGGFDGHPKGPSDRLVIAARA
jgi:SAM-dependent methyltransferase